MRISTIFLLAITAMLLFSFSVKAQLSGIKTIGGNNPDFPTFESAINALNTENVGDSPLTFLVRSGIYNETPNLSITDVNLDGNSSVIFQPDEGAEVEVNFSLPNFAWGFRIQNSKNITFSGLPYNSVDTSLRAMTVNGNRIDDGDQFFTVYISNGSENSGFTNLVITHEDNQERVGFSLPVYISTHNVATPEVGMQNLFVSNCLIVGGNTYGIFIDGDPDKKVIRTQITNNEIKDFARFGVLLQSNADSTLIVGNEIYQTFMGRSAVYGVNIGGSNHYSTIAGNFIHSLIPSELAGLRGVQLNVGTTNNLIYNNAIHVIPAETNNVSYGLYVLGGDNANNRIYYNSIYIGGYTTRNVSSYALRVSKDISDDELINNVLVNVRTGGTANHYALALRAITFPISDHNFLSTMSTDPSDNRYVARIGVGASAVDYKTLDDLINAPGYAPRDENSLTGNPLWQLPELSIGEDSPLVNSGMAVQSIDYDILGNPRDTENPDIGAFEYQAPLPCIAPDELFAGNITSSSAVLNWSAQGNEDQWDILWNISDQNAKNGGNLIEGIMQKPFLLEGLDHNTEYVFYVRSVCGDETTEWSEPAFFTTENIAFEIVASSGEGGTIEPSGTIQVEAGSTQQFLFTPNEGYQISDVVVDEQSIGVTTSYTFENVQQDHSIFVEFEPVVFVITATADENGSISPQGEVEVLYGNDQEFIITPNPGFEVSALYINGEQVEAAEFYLFENVTQNNTIHAVFQQLFFTITFTITDTGNHPITDAVITLDDVENEAGNYVFEGLSAGTYAYTVSKHCFVDAVGEIIVNEDLTVEVVLILHDMPGDANGDGDVNLLDVIMIANYYAGVIPDNFCFHNADVNGDGIINILDVVAIINIYADGKMAPHTGLQSEPAQMFLNAYGISLKSDGTLAGVQFELTLEDMADAQLKLELPGYEMIHVYENGVLRVMIFSLNNAAIPAGKVELLAFDCELDARWLEALAANLNAERVPVVLNDEMVTGIETAEGVSLRVYPNPATDILWVEFDNPGNSLLSLINISGQVVASKLLTETGMQQVEFNLGGLPAGIYMVRMDHNSTFFIERVIVK